MQLIRSFFRRITNDLKQKKLIPLKILFFAHASTGLVLYPYLTIHMRELGINVEETAIMSAVTPVLSIIMPPLAGMIADKIGNFRSLLAFSSVLGGLSALLLLFVPVGRITVTFPTSVELLVTCDQSALHIQHMKEYPCIPVHPYAYDINMTVLSCGFLCDLPKNISQKETDSIKNTHAYDIHMQSRVQAQRLIYRHVVSSPLMQTMAPVNDQSTSRILTNNPYFNTTASQISGREIFFPASRLYQMECTYDTDNETCLFGLDVAFTDTPDAYEDVEFRVRISHEAHETPTDMPSYWVKAIANKNSTNLDADYYGIDKLTCKDNYNEFVEDAGVQVLVGTQKLLGCSAACAALAPRKEICSNEQQRIDIDPGLTVWAYLAVRVFMSIIGGTAFAMFEGAVIAIIREHKADYGLQRVYGSIGGMISSPLSGLMIDYASRGKGYTDFRPAFYLYAVLKVTCGFLIFGIDLEFKQPANNLVQDVIKVFKNVEIVALFIACFIMGTAWGYIESFLFWLLQDLGGSKSLMGITITVAGVAGLPLLVLSGPIISKLGHANVLFIGFVFYAIRLLGYSLIYNPWLCLIFEAMESVTSSLSFTAAVTYAAKLSSTTTDTSVQGLLGGIYFGVGKGSGSLIGGYLIKFFGTRPTYQIFASATLITGCVYFLFNKFYLSKRIKDSDDICKNKPDNESNEKSITKTDVTSNIESTTLENILTEAAVTKGVDKIVSNSIDGGSDSGVDNPVFSETEPTIGRKDNSIIST